MKSLNNLNKDSIMISTQPRWVEKIFRGIKTVDIRKERPKKQPPFKCFIYCTKTSELWGDGTGATWQGIDPDENMEDVIRLNPTLTQLNGKVVGEFVCDKIDTYISEFYIPTQSNVKYIGDVYEDICQIHINDDGEKEFFVETSNECPNPNDCTLCKNTCLSFDEIKNYLGNGFTYFYGWHISNLKIYEQPKELDKFKSRALCPQAQYSKILDVWYCKDGYTKSAITDNSRNFPYNEECIYFDCPKVGESERAEYAYCTCDGHKKITRPPQSWCYVKQLGDCNNE